MTSKVRKSKRRSFLLHTIGKKKRLFISGHVKRLSNALLVHSSFRCIFVRTLFFHPFSEGLHAHGSDLGAACDGG